ncbi:MAG UNVERIFIED_CONTAM: PEP-CTERM sorting domain-containing protein [Microcystis novacekii LVE1205-3]
MDDDASALKMNFSHLMKSLSLDFGNDNPFFSSPGDTAELTLFLGATQVGFVSVPMNRDDIMNQTISFPASGQGQYFDMATFFYNVAVPTPAGTSGLVEIVDNIEFQPVPEPSTVLGLGLLGLGALVKRQLKPKQDSDKA